MIKNKIKKIAIVAVSAMLLGGTAYAVDGISGGNIVKGAQKDLNFTFTNAVNATGGYSNEVNVTTSASSIKWQGFYGTVSGDIKLGAGDDVLFDFGAIDFRTLFVTRGTDIDWAGLNIGNTGTADASYGFSNPADSDQMVDVFNDTATIAGISNVPSVTIGNFTFGLFDDGPTTVTDTVFGVNLENPGKGGFDGNIYNYQMMVPVKALETNTYYFYATLE